MKIEGESKTRYYATEGHLKSAITNIKPRRFTTWIVKRLFWEQASVGGNNPQ